MLIFQIDDEDIILKSSKKAFGKFKEKLKKLQEKEIKNQSKSANSKGQKEKSNKQEDSQLSNSIYEKESSSYSSEWSKIGLRRNNMDVNTLEYETAISDKDFWDQMNQKKAKNLALPDVILLDLRLNDDQQEQSGLNLLKEIRKFNDFEKIPVIMFSQFADHKYVTISKELGANAYVAKDGANYDDRFLELLVHWAGTVEPYQDRHKKNQKI